MSHEAIGVCRTWMVLVSSALLLSCSPPAARPRPAPPPRRVPADPLTQMRAAMQRWGKELKAKASDKSVDLALYFRWSQGQPVTFPVSSKCKGRGMFFNVVANSDPSPAGSARPHLAWPVIFVHMMSAPSVAPPAERKAYPTPPNNCLVTIQRVKGRLTLVAKPVDFAEEESTIDKAEFIHRGGCRFLQLTTSYDKNTGPDGPPMTNRGESVRLWRFPPDGPQVASYYVTSREETGGNAYSSSVSGTATWMKLGGLDVLFYQSSWIESSQSTGHRSKIVVKKTVEKVDADCDLVRILPDELLRLRKLPGGKKLPDHQIDPEEAD